jgi:rRNA processing protein Gar1
MVLVGDEAQVEARFICLEIVLILMQDRCTVYAEYTIGSEIILVTPDVGHVESCFGPLETVFVLVQDRCMFCAKRSIGPGTVLDAPDGTPRGQA